jgi:hypothetical protein
LITPGVGLAGDVVKVKFNAVVQEYCHVLKFPSGWQMPKSVLRKTGEAFIPAKFALSDDYEFRVRGLLGTRFLVRGVERVVNKYYTSSIYEADFSDPTGVAQPSSEEEWNAATSIAVSDYRFTGLTKALDKLSKRPEFKALDSKRKGDKWLASARQISPDLSLLVLQTSSGKLSRCGGSDVPGDFSPCLDFRGNHGKLFFDIYRTDTLEKVVTITASFNTIRPDEAFEKTVWVTGRYFLIPLDERRERCLICDFGRKGQ